MMWCECHLTPADDHFDYIYNLPYPYDKVTRTSEQCPGLDV